MPYEHYLSLTSLANGQTISSVLKGGYHYDVNSLVIYKSNSDNVYQWTCNVVKSEDDQLSLAGNYVVGTQQIEIANLHGTPTDFMFK